LRQHKSSGGGYILLAFALLVGAPTHLWATDAGTLLDAFENDNLSEYMKGKLQQKFQYVTDKFPSFASEQSPSTRNTYAQEIADTTDTRDKLIPVRSTGPQGNPDVVESTGDFAKNLPKPIASIVNTMKDVNGIETYFGDKVDAAKSQLQEKYDNLKRNAADMRDSIQGAMHSAGDYLGPAAESSPTLEADSRPVSEPSRLEQASPPAAPKDFADASFNGPPAPAAAPKPPSDYDKKMSRLAAELDIDDPANQPTSKRHSGSASAEATELAAELGIDVNDRRQGTVDLNQREASADADLQAWEDQQAEKRRVAELQRQQEVARLAEVDRQREARRLQIAREDAQREAAERETAAVYNPLDSEATPKVNSLSYLLQGAHMALQGLQIAGQMQNARQVPSLPAGDPLGPQKKAMQNQTAPAVHQQCVSHGEVRCVGP
jgi:hypothetical protein